MVPLPGIFVVFASHTLSEEENSFKELHADIYVVFNVCFNLLLSL